MNYKMYTTLGLVERVKYNFYVTAENGVSNVGLTTPLPVLISEVSDNSILINGIVIALVIFTALAAALLIIFIISFSYVRRKLW